MGFKTIEKNSGGRAMAIGIAIAQQNGKRQGRHFVIRFGLDVMTALGVSKGARLVLAYGTGRDAGWLRIVAGDLNGYTLTYSGHRAKAACLRIKTLVNVSTGSHGMAIAPHKFKNGALYVKLPDWARDKTAKAT